MRPTLGDTTSEFDGLRVIERPDGYYWSTPDGARERGPFATILEAEDDMRLFDEESIEVGETLAEAEAEIGVAEWIDPDTGEPAEESLARIEEH